MSDTDLHKTIDQMARDIQLIKALLTGNSEPETGLIVKVDRLEQAEVKRRWLVGIAVTSACGAVVTTFTRMFTGQT